MVDLSPVTPPRHNAVPWEWKPLLPIPAYSPSGASSAPAGFDEMPTNRQSESVDLSAFGRTDRRVRR